MLHMLFQSRVIHKYIIKTISTNLRRCALKMFGRPWKVANAFVRSNNMIWNSSCHLWVWNAVLFMSDDVILIWWYPYLRSMLENIDVPCSLSNNSPISGIGIYPWRSNRWAFGSLRTSSMYDLSFWLVQPMMRRPVTRLNYSTLQLLAHRHLDDIFCGAG